MSRQNSLGRAPDTYYDNTDRTCRWCRAELTNKRRKRFCRDECQTEYWIRRDSHRLSWYVKVRDNWTCSICFLRHELNPTLLHADHIVPIADGGDEFDPDNVRTLCVYCHKAVTKQWHAGRRKPEQPKPVFFMNPSLQIEMAI